MLDGMGENAERLFQEHRERLIGRPVTFTRLAANSLLVYIDGEPGSGTGLTFWFEPTWHLLGPAGVLLGSRQAQTEDAENHSRLSDLPLKLFQKKVEEVSVSPITHDIHVLFEGAYAIATFVSDPTDVESWHIRDNQTKQRVVGCAKGLRVTEVE